MPASGSIQPVPAAVRALTIVAAAADLALFAAWAPHYLTWPWWVDADAFAVLAQSWSVGILPYRDVVAFNFPGATYLMSTLGALFGWGRTVPLLAFDALLVALFGLTQLAWSRRIFGLTLPGWLGFGAFLAHYLDLDYSQVAQRDGHAPLLVVLGLLAMQARPGRAARLGSAALSAMAFAIRPHVVFFLPALLFEARLNSLALRRSAVYWLVCFGTGATLSFIPLWIGGMFEGFLEGVSRASYLGAYHRTSWPDVGRIFLDQLARPSVLLPLVGLAVLAVRRPRLINGPEGWPSTAWLLAMCGALVYKPLHPVPHDYLDQPLAVVGSVAWAILAGSILRSPGWTGRWAPAFVLAAALGTSATGPPRYCSIVKSLEAPAVLLSGEPPRPPPLGYAKRATLPNAAWYPWRDYRALLLHLHRTVGPETRVANVLKGFPAVNGPVGRLSPFPIESGVVWVWLEGREVEERLTHALERSTDSVVVWIPDEQGPVLLPLEILGPVIRRLYRFEARFGAIEVWRRREPSLDRIRSRPEQ